LFDINFLTKLVDDSRLSIMRDNVYAIFEKSIVIRFMLASRWNILIYILAFKYIEILLFFLFIFLYFFLLR